MKSIDTKIVIFDLDGTLLNTLQDLADSTNFALNYFAYPSRTLEDVRNFVGDGVAKLIERAIPDGINNPKFEDCLELFKNHYSQNMYNKTAPYPKIIELLQEIKSKNIKIAVVSNKFDAAVKDLCAKYFNGLIDFASGENEMLGIRKKPSADAVIRVLENFNIERENAFYVGDSQVDILTAKNAQIPCISVTWGYKTKDFLIKNGAEYLVNNPEDILLII